MESLNLIQLFQSTPITSVAVNYSGDLDYFEIEVPLQSPFQKTPILGDIVKIDGFDQSPWTDFNTILTITDYSVYGNFVLRITADTSLLFPYSGTLPTVTILPTLSRQKDATITGISKIDDSSLKITVDDVVALRSTTPVVISGVVLSGGTYSFASDDTMYFEQLIHRDVNSFILKSSNSNNWANIGTYSSGGVISLPYGGKINISNDTIAGLRIGDKVITSTEYDLEIKLITNMTDDTDDLTMTLMMGTDESFSPSYPITEIIKSSDTEAMFLLSTGAFLPPTIVVRGVSVPVEKLMLFIKVDDPASLSNNYVDFSGIDYASILVNHFADKYGRVDVGYIEGSTPEDKSDIASEVANTLSSDDNFLYSIAEKIINNPDASAGNTSPIMVDENGKIELSPTGLDEISPTEPGGRASNFREMIIQVWMRFFNRVEKDEDNISVYNDTDDTVVTTQSYEEGTTDIVHKS